MVLSNPEQITRQRRTCDQSPDYDAAYDPVGVRGERSWEEPIGVWGGKTYEELYVEHAPAARRLASSMVPHDVAGDIVAEAFAKVLAVIRAGGGPSHAFGGYLLTAVRNLASDWLKARRRLTVVGDMDMEAGDRAAAGRGRVTPGIGSAAEAQAQARDEARRVARAFGRLPARWRAVLWELEVEGKAPAAVAPMFGLSANGVSALAMRAREGLRQAYLEEHIGTNIPVPCRAYAAEFGAGARGRLSQRRGAAMQEHLGRCPGCQDLFTELTELNSRLGAILTPAALAAASAAMHAGRHAVMIRAGLTAQWRTWRLHPVTAAAGAAAGAAVAGGMLFAVNVTPVTGSPSHIAAQPAVAASGPSANRRGHGGGVGGAAGPNPLPGTLSLPGTASLAGTGSLPGTMSLAGVTSWSGPAASDAPGSTATAGTATSAVATSAVTGDGTTASTMQIDQAAPTGETTASPLPSPPASPPANVAAAAPASAPGNPGQTIATAVDTTVSGLTSTASTTVSNLTSTAGATVSDLASTAGSAVSGVADTATSAVTGVASTAVAAVTGTENTAVGTAAAAVTGVASTAVATVTNTASPAVGTAAAAVTGVASTAVATVTNTASPAAATTSLAGGQVLAGSNGSPLSAVLPAASLS